MTSGDNQFDPRLLWQLPLIELNIDVRLRRMLINAGFSSLGEAFDLSDRELDSRIGPDATDNILNLAKSRCLHRTGNQKDDSIERKSN